MVVQTVASGSVASAIGSIIGALLIPGTGLLLLILGLVRRSNRRRQPAPPAGHPVRQQQWGQPWGQGVTPGSGMVFPNQAPWSSPPGFAPPPVPGQPHPVSGQPPPMGAPPAPRGSSGTVLIVVGAVLIVLGLVGVIGAATSRNSGHGGSRTVATGDSALQKGNCISSADFERHDLDATAIDCSRPEAVFELASRGDGSATCPDGERGDTAYGALTDSKRTLCFLPNMKEGQCYFADTTTNVISPVGCTDSTANVRVAERIDVYAKTGLCAPGQKQTAFPTPPRSYCLVPPG